MALSVCYFGLPFSNRHWILVVIRFMISGFFSILIPSSPQKRVCLNWNFRFLLASWVNQSAYKIWFHSLVLKFIYHLNSLFPFPSLKYKRIYLYIIIFFFLFGSVLFYFIPYRFSTSPNACGWRLERVIHPHVDLFWSMLRWIHHRVTCSTWSHDPKKMKRNSMMDESLGSSIYIFFLFLKLVTTDVGFECSRNENENLPDLWLGLRNFFSHFSPHGDAYEIFRFVLV